MGIEHLLLRLIREGEGIACQVLVKMGADLKQVRDTVLQPLSDPPDKPDQDGTSAREGHPLFPNPVVAESLLDRLLNDAHHLQLDTPSYRTRQRPKTQTI